MWSRRNWGLGDSAVGSRAEPDEYLVLDTHRSIITRRRGTKETKVVCAGRGVKAVPASLDERQRDVLDDDEVLTLTCRAVAIEQVYGPATIEWAKDGASGGLYVVQVRPDPHSRTSTRTPTTPK